VRASAFGRTCSLTSTTSSRKATAWYVFVLYDRDGGEPLKMRRMRPATVTTLVEEIGDGEWNLAGHQRRERQQKVPWTEVFDQ